jgi:hypothetical protein
MRPPRLSRAGLRARARLINTLLLLFTTELIQLLWTSWLGSNATLVIAKRILAKLPLIYKQLISPRALKSCPRRKASCYLTSPDGLVRKIASIDSLRSDSAPIAQAFSTGLSTGDEN